MTTSAALRTALATALAAALSGRRSLEYVDLGTVRHGGRVPLGKVNPFVNEFFVLLNTVVEEHPAYCPDCDHAGASCGGGCGGSFWSTDWYSVRRAAFDAEVRSLGIESNTIGWVVVPTVDFHGPRTPEKEYSVLAEHMSWARQDYERGQDPEGVGYEAASASAAAFQAEYADRI